MTRIKRKQTDHAELYFFFLKFWLFPHFLGFQAQIDSEAIRFHRRRCSCGEDSVNAVQIIHHFIRSCVASLSIESMAIANEE